MSAGLKTNYPTRLEPLVPSREGIQGGVLVSAQVEEHTPPFGHPSLVGKKPQREWPSQALVRSGRPRLPHSPRKAVGAEGRTPTTNTECRCSIHRFFGESPVQTAIDIMIASDYYYVV